ncbi:RNA methyltransferase, TrmH family, group 3 [Desulfovibrio sp. X2]|uniref:23S rRNA (guanosine(2251)-2'-O)-methyltransferase RlmB n=1 Tax=Desulfovibrio sp. X2 TaxID=941449 RepID=UPI000358A143|nr:23S rRNA (guanosine(2251)-2'-O)-methyltransferase RlmB [Desulfovibrio sp. X2]EPR44024.1 RNA methyltransferase, TrmH family, group 3 [Desulfovibrio sp. X2]
MSENKKTDPKSEGLVVGRHPVSEALSAHPERVEAVLVQRGLKGETTDRILDACRAAHVRFRLCEKSELDRLYSGPHQGVAAMVAPMAFRELDDLLAGLMDAPLPLLVVLDQVQDPHNVGALARSLLAFGAAGLVLPKHGAARLGAGAFKASAGALSRLPVARVTNLAQALDRLADEGLPIYCAAAGPGSESLFEARLHLPAALVLGNEEKGVRQGLSKRCAAALEIPMPGGFDSLNVAQAGTVIASHFARAVFEAARRKAEKAQRM